MPTHLTPRRSRFHPPLASLEHRQEKIRGAPRAVEVEGNRGGPPRPDLPDLLRQRGTVEVVGIEHPHDAELLEPSSTRPLLVLALLPKWHHDRRHARAHELERGVVAALAHRHGRPT